jgi:hypothetical protein
MHCGKRTAGAFTRCALGLALLQALHLRIFRQLRLGRAHRQPRLAVTVDEEIELGVATIAA